MKVRFENDEILVDFNPRGWNPETLISEVSDEYYQEFIKESNNTFGGTDDMELKDCVEVIILLAQNDIIS